MSLVIKVLVDDQAVQATSAQAKLLKVAINNLQNDIRKTADMGVPIAKEAEERLKKLKAQYATVTTMRDQIKEQDRAPMMQRQNERMEERIGKGMARVFGGSLAQKFLSGGKIEAADIVREAVAADRLIMRGLKAAGVAEATIAEAAPLIPLIGEAVSRVMEGFDIARDEKKFAQKVGREFAAGGMSQQEFDLFQANNYAGSTGSPSKILEKAQKAADAFEKMQDSQSQEIIDKFNSDDAKKSTLSATWDILSGKRSLGDIAKTGLEGLLGGGVKNARDIKNKIQAAMQARKNELGVATLDNTEREKIIRGVFIDAGFSDELQNRLVKAGEEMQDSDKKAQKSASVSFKEEEMKIQNELGFQLRNKRIPANPVDF